MANINELTTKLKTAAQKATPGRIGDRIDGSGSIKYQCVGYDGSLVLQVDHKNMEYGFIGDNADADEEFFRACVPDAILALIEALEVAEKRVLLPEHENVHYADAAEMEIAALRQRITELEARTLTVKLPFRFQDSTMATIWENAGIDRCTEAFQKACAAAGIALQIEGE